MRTSPSSTSPSAPAGQSWLPLCPPAIPAPVPVSHPDQCRASQGMASLWPPPRPLLLPLAVISSPMPPLVVFSLLLSAMVWEVTSIHVGPSPTQHTALRVSIHPLPLAPTLSLQPGPSPVNSSLTYTPVPWGLYTLFCALVKGTGLLCPSRGEDTQRLTRHWIHFIACPGLGPLVLRPISLFPCSVLYGGLSPEGPVSRTPRSAQLSSGISCRKPCWRREGGRKGEARMSLSGVVSRRVCPSLGLAPSQQANSVSGAPPPPPNQVWFHHLLSISRVCCPGFLLLPVLSFPAPPSSGQPTACLTLPPVQILSGFYFRQFL